jgi:phenylalanine ammonia-lyase
MSPQNEPLSPSHRQESVIIRGEGLTIDEVARVSQGAKVRLTEEPAILQHVHASHDYVMQAVENNQPIYGITTCFGGMANIVIPHEEATELQNNLVWSHKTGAGKRLPLTDVRASMLLRANSLMRGISGIRLQIIRRLELFLNAGVTPHVYEFGSIGASGDLVPLAYIAGAIIGLDARYTVDFRGEEVDCLTALERLGLPRLRLRPKEGLALMNGTSVMTGIAANCVSEAQKLLALTMGTHALMAQGLYATNQSFHPFIHQHKPHPGQRWSAKVMLDLLADSQLVRHELEGQHEHRGHDLIQDRYSLRCLPQYMGPIVDGIAQIARQVEVEANSATDNPLIDLNLPSCYHSGNFLGQYIGVAMDQLRYYLGLMAKHLDTQIALLVAPEFSNGLPPSLVGNPERRVNVGLKPLQLCGNSIMPLLLFNGNSLADRFPTHAEQFNQNINSQGFGSANLSRHSLDMFQRYMAIALIFGVQAVDLRTYKVARHYDARSHLSPTTVTLYEAVRQVVGRAPSEERPYIWNDNEQALDEHIARIAADLQNEGHISKTINQILSSVQAHTPYLPR